jgi:hypothetical protein
MSALTTQTLRQLSLKNDRKNIKDYLEILKNKDLKQGEIAKNLTVNVSKLQKYYPIGGFP